MSNEINSEQQTCATNVGTSPTLLGNINVLLTFANLLNALTYCSATLSAAAFFASVTPRAFATTCNPFARASATATTAAASPLALFICSCLSASTVIIKFIVTEVKFFINRVFAYTRCFKTSA